MAFEGAQHIQVGGRDRLTLKSVKYTGSDALRAGYLVCYDRDNATATTNAGAAIALTSESYARHRYVEKPAAGNVRSFAGVVSRDYDAVTGGRIIDIEVPIAGGFVTNLFSSANATANSTPLYVQAGSYVAGSSGGTYLGRALQTVDRSSTNGLVQAIVYPTLESSVEYGTDASTNPSQTIWSNLPSVADLLRDPSLGRWVDTRYGNTGWTSNSDTSAVLDRGTAGEFTLFTSADNDECGLVFNQNGFKIGSGSGKLAFEARLKLSIVNKAHGMFIGLCSEMARTNFLNDTGAVAVNTRDYFGLSVPEADPDGGDLFALESGGTQVTLDADAVAFTADTYVKFGFYYNGTDVITYNAGTAIGDNALAAEIASTTFPTNISMAPAMWVKGGATDDYTVTVAWLRCIQID